MIQTLTSLSSHGCAQAYARQILYMLSWLPIASNCSSTCPSKHLTAAKQALANTQQSSSHLADYNLIKLDDVLLTTYLTTSHVHACTPLATIKKPSNIRQTTLQHHHNNMPTTAKRTVSTPNATAKNLVTVQYAAVLQLPYSLQTGCKQTTNRLQTDYKQAANRLQTGCKQTTNRLQTVHKEPSVNPLPSCLSLVTHLRFTCPTIALLLRDN